MPPFRPANLNKRAYPGNASVIGPTCTATLGITTTQCCTFVSTLCGACTETLNLGCRCATTSCPCCPCCCCCSCTVCARTVPSGRWKASEQYEARTRDAWGDTNCVTGSVTGFCGSSGTITGSPVDCKGFFWCCGPSTCKWFVAPRCTEVCRSFNSTSNGVTVANSLMGSCGWFVPDLGNLYNGYLCRSYWDSYCVNSQQDPEGNFNYDHHWSTTTGPNASYGGSVAFRDGSCGTGGFNFNGTKTRSHIVRVFRCTLT
jgi:hypothetical protein